MGRNSRQATDNAGAHPVGALDQIQDILGTGKAKSHTSCIDNTVKILVIVGVLAQEEPQHREFGHLLGQRGGEQSR